MLIPRSRRRRSSRSAVPTTPAAPPPTPGRQVLRSRRERPASFFRLVYRAVATPAGRRRLRRRILTGVLSAGVLFGGYQGVKIVRSLGTRNLNVCVLTDFAFRDQRPNWQAQLQTWIAETNRLFQSSDVHWTVTIGGEAYPEDVEGRLMDRRDLIEESASCQADVVLGLTATPDRDANAMVIPFAHAGLVAVTAADSDAIAVRTLSRALAKFFGAPIGTEAVVLVDSPSVEILDAPSQKLVADLRNYDFSQGISALTGRWEQKAVAAIAQAVATRKQNPTAEARRILGRAFAAARRHNQAVAQFREAVRLVPRDALLRIELAMELQADAQTDEAIAEFRRAAEADPEDARPHAMAGAIFLNRNMPQQAIDELRAAVALDPHNPGYEATLGKALTMQVGHSKEAAEAFEAALRLKPNDDSLRQAIDAVHGDQEKLEGVVTNAVAQVRQRPEAPDAHLRLGIALAAAGDRAAAVKEIDRALALEPQNAVAHLALARMYFLDGAYRQAQAEAEAAQRAGLEPSKTFLEALKRKLAAN